jgi:hypothetical protein
MRGDSPAGINCFHQEGMIHGLATTARSLIASCLLLFCHKYCRKNEHVHNIHAQAAASILTNASRAQAGRGSGRLCNKKYITQG